MGLECPAGRGGEKQVAETGADGEVTLVVPRPGRCLLRVDARPALRVTRVVRLGPGARQVANVLLRHGVDRLGPCGETVGFGQGADPGGELRWGQAERLPVRSLGGMEAVARHPALGGLWAPGDRVRVDGARWVSPELPDFLRWGVEDGTVYAGPALEDAKGQLRLDLGPEGPGGSAGLYEALPQGWSRHWLDVGVGLDAGGVDVFVRDRPSLGRWVALDGRFVGDGERGDLALGLRTWPGKDWELHPSLGLELGPSVTPYGGFVVESWLDPVELLLSAKAWAGDEAHPAAADLRLHGRIGEGHRGLEVDLGARSRGEEGLRPDGHLGAWAALETGPHPGVYLEAARRWEGIDTVAEPLLGREELELGVGLDDSLWGSVRLGPALVWRGGAEDLLLLRLQQHRMDHGAATSHFVLTWAPEFGAWNVGEPTLAAGLLWGPSVRPLPYPSWLDLGFGVAADAAWRAAPGVGELGLEGGAAGRISASVCEGEGWYTVALEGGVREGAAGRAPEVRGSLSWAPTPCTPRRGGNVELRTLR